MSGLAGSAALLTKVLTLPCGCAGDPSSCRRDLQGGLARLAVLRLTPRYSRPQEFTNDQVVRPPVTRTTMLSQPARLRPGSPPSQAECRGLGSRRPLQHKRRAVAGLRRRGADAAS